jgi:hypothetical protein
MSEVEAAVKRIEDLTAELPRLRHPWHRGGPQAARCGAARAFLPCRSPEPLQPNLGKYRVLDRLAAAAW